MPCQIPLDSPPVVFLFCRPTWSPNRSENPLTRPPVIRFQQWHSSKYIAKLLLTVFIPVMLLRLCSSVPARHTDLIPSLSASCCTHLRPWSRPYPRPFLANLRPSLHTYWLPSHSCFMPEHASVLLIINEELQCCVVSHLPNISAVQNCMSALKFPGLQLLTMLRRYGPNIHALSLYAPHVLSCLHVTYIPVVMHVMHLTHGHYAPNFINIICFVKHILLCQVIPHISSCT